MNAAVIHAFDAPPTFDIFPDLVLQSGEILVNVRAAALHQIVKSLANGSHYASTANLPFIPGVDGVGILQTDTPELAAGTRIYFGAGRPPYGTFAPQTIAAPYMLIPLPDEIPDALAAGIANPAMSSWMALTRAHFTPGDSVLILGATGTSGQLAIQIAKHRGAKRIVAAGRNPEALAKLQSLGADATISLSLEPTDLIEAFRAEFAQGIDIVLDYLWGPPAEAALAAIAHKSLKNTAGRVRYVDIGSTAGPNITLPAATLRSANLELLGSGFGSANMDQIRQSITEFFTLAATHPFDFAYKTIPLADVTPAWNEKSEAVRLVFQP